MTMTYRALILLVTLSIVASLAHPQEKPSEEPAPAKQNDDAKDEKKAEAPKPGTTVSLLEAGQEPRSELRYEAGGKSRFVLSVRGLSEQTVMGLRPPATPIPEVRFTIESETAATGDDAPFALRLRFADVEVVPDANVPPPVLQVTQRTTGAMKGRSAELIVSNRGVVESMDVEDTAMLRGEMIMGDVIEIMREALHSAIIALPQEPVGVGARWRVESRRKIGGLDMTERIEYRIVAFEGGSYRIATETTRSAKDQPIPTPASARPNLPDRILETFESSNKGLGTLVLANMVPVESRREEKQEMELAIIGRGGGKHVMQQTTELWTRIWVAPKANVDSEKSEKKESPARPRGG